MELELTADQEFFLSTTRRFLDDKVPPSELRAHRNDDVGFRRGLWTEGATLGWMSLLAHEDVGGGVISGRPVCDAALLAFEFGRHAAPGPLVPANVAALALTESMAMPGTPDHRNVLTGVVGGEIVSWAHAEPRPNHGLGAVSAVLEGDRGATRRLQGVKSPVESAVIAGWFLVSARDCDGLTQVLVPADAPGVTISPLQGIDVTKRYATVRFDDVAVPDSAVVGERGAAHGGLDRQMQVAIALELQESVGCLSKAMDITVEWAFDRYSFGRPLASYQALKHRFANMKLWLEASHAIADAAARAVDERTTDAWDLLSAGKAYIGKHGVELMHECVQMHGGIGVTYEHDIHLYLRRVVLNAHLNGTAAEHRQRLTTSLEQMQGASA